MTANPLIFEFGNRKGAISTARPATRARQRAAQAAATLSRTGQAKAAAELCNEAVLRLIGLAYEVDPDIEAPANVDPATGLLLIPAPWSSHNYTSWGLRATEAEALRAYMMRLGELADKGKGAPPAFVFDPVSRRWGLNIWDYPRPEQALAWWAKYELSAKTFSMFADYVRKRRKAYAQKRARK